MTSDGHTVLSVIAAASQMADPAELLLDATAPNTADAALPGVLLALADPAHAEGER